MTSGVSVSETSVATRSPTVETERGPLPHLLDGADEHAARAGLGVLHLAAAADDVEHLGADRVAVAVVLALELAERRRVEVEPLDADPDLVGPQLAAGVEPDRGLRQHAAGLEHPVQPDGTRAGSTDGVRRRSRVVLR